MGCFKVLGQVNYLAVLVCTAISMVMGALWYSPVLFGNAWMKGVGFKKEDISKSDSSKAMMGSVVIAFVMNVVLASFTIMTQAKGFWGGVHVGALVGVGFIAMVLLMNSLYEKTSLKVWLIHSFYQTILLMINGGILTIWK
jgi:hypothetical protein